MFVGQMHEFFGDLLFKEELRVKPLQAVAALLESSRSAFVVAAELLRASEHIVASIVSASCLHLLAQAAAATSCSARGSRFSYRE